MSTALPRWPLLGLLLILAALGLLLAVPPPSDRSTTDHGAEGTAAFAAVVQGMGLPMERLRVGLRVLNNRPSSSVLFLPMAPGIFRAPPLSDRDVSWLAAFMERGGTVVAPSHYQNALWTFASAEHHWNSLPRGQGGGQRAAPTLLHPLTVAGPLSLNSRSSVDPGADATVLFAVGEEPVVTLQKLGLGRLVLVADPATLSNAGIGQGANLDFYLSIIAHFRGPSAPVLFDDLHAGGGEDRGIIAYARSRGMFPALGLLLLAGVLFLWRASTRFGVPLSAVPVEDPRVAAEHIFAVAALYERAGLNRHAARVLARRFRRLLQRRLPGTSSSAEIDLRLRRERGQHAAADFGRIRGALERLMELDAPSLAAILRLVGHMDQFERRHLRRSREERR